MAGNLVWLWWSLWRCCGGRGAGRSALCGGVRLRCTTWFGQLARPLGLAVVWSRWPSCGGCCGAVAGIPAGRSGCALRSRSVGALCGCALCWSSVVAALCVCAAVVCSLPVVVAMAGCFAVVVACCPFWSLWRCCGGRVAGRSALCGCTLFRCTPWFGQLAQPLGLAVVVTVVQAVVVAVVLWLAYLLVALAALGGYALWVRFVTVLCAGALWRLRSMSAPRAVASAASLWWLLWLACFAVVVACSCRCAWLLRLVAMASGCSGRCGSTLWQATWFERGAHFGIAVLIVDCWPRCSRRP